MSVTLFAALLTPTSSFQCCSVNLTFSFCALAQLPSLSAFPSLLLHGSFISLPLFSHNFNVMALLQQHSLILLLSASFLSFSPCGGKTLLSPNKDAPPEWKLLAEINNDIRQ